MSASFAKTHDKNMKKKEIKRRWGESNFWSDWHQRASPHGSVYVYICNQTRYKVESNILSSSSVKVTLLQLLQYIIFFLFFGDISTYFNLHLLLSCVTFLRFWKTNLYKSRCFNSYARNVYYCRVRATYYAIRFFSNHMIVHFSMGEYVSSHVFEKKKCL